MPVIVHLFTGAKQCDRTYPTCERCQKRGTECSLSLLVASTQLSTVQTTAPSTTASLDIKPKRPYQVRVFRCSVTDPASNPSSSGTSPLAPSPNRLPPNLRVLQQQQFNLPVLNQQLSTTNPCHQHLFNQFSQTTSLTLATDTPGQKAWQIHVPQLAHSHSFVANFILAVTSLHLAQIHSSDVTYRTELSNIAISQMSKALRSFRQELANINPTNAPALFACATLTVVYLFRTTTLELQEMQSSIPARMTRGSGSRMVDRGIQSIIQIFGAIRGVMSILMPDRNWVASSSISPVGTRGWWPKKAIPADEKAMDEDRRLAALERLWMQPGRKPEGHLGHLSSALATLRTTYALVSMLTEEPGMEKKVPGLDDVEEVGGFDYTTEGVLRDRGAIFRWVTNLTREFVELVERKNIDALVITAHYAVLIGRVRDVWWMDGLGAAMVRTIAMALGKESLGLIEWPATVLGVERVGSDDIE